MLYASLVQHSKLWRGSECKGWLVPIFDTHENQYMVFCTLFDSHIQLALSAFW